jgi:transposase
VDETRRRRSGSASPSTTPWCPVPADRRATRPPPDAAAARSRSLWLPGRALDTGPHCRGDSTNIWRLLPSHPYRPLVQGDPLESPKACAARAAARRSGDCTLARADLARPQKGAQEQQQRIFFIDESGFYPLPSVVRTYAPVGHTPILREWWTRDHLSAISAISPEGKLYFHCQDGAMNSADVVAFLEHLLREVPGRMVIIWDGSPIHRSQTVKEFLANGASQRLHLERLPAYAPELNPDEGVWQQLKGVELRNLCCFDLRHLRHELRTAVKRVRRKPRILKGCFAGAGLL